MPRRACRFAGISRMAAREGADAVLGTRRWSVPSPRAGSRGTPYTSRMEHESHGYDARPPETMTPGQDELGQGAEAPTPAEARLSRRNAWLAMGAVALALGLIWMAPALTDTHVDPATGETEFPGEPGDAAAAGKAAPL